MSRLTENLKTLEEIGKLNRYIMNILENSLEEHNKEIRNKAIDEFAERVKEVYPFTILELEQLDEIAGQLKAGGTDE